MAKIFITGVSASYASKKVSERTFNFSGALNKVLTSSGHDVTWGSPSFSITQEELDTYDAILIGLSALTSVSSDRAYGALNLINKLWGDSRLTLFIDTPSPSQIEVSLTSILTNPETLTKPFFSFRKDYSLMMKDPEAKASVMNAVTLLKNENWGRTIYPKLPWRQESDIKLPVNAKSQLVGINLDAHLIFDFEPVEKVQKWVIDSSNNKWAKSVLPSLVMPHSPMKWDKGTYDSEVFNQIAKSVGVLISPDNKDGTWWSYRYIQALSAGTPIATQWQETAVLGEAWMVLASSIETMSQQKRDLVALAQRESYLANIPTEEMATYELHNAINVKELLWVK